MLYILYNIVYIDFFNFWNFVNIISIISQKKIMINFVSGGYFCDTMVRVAAWRSKFTSERLTSRHLLYWLGNILKVCTVYNTSECGIDSFKGTHCPWERIEKWIEQIEKTPGNDNVVVETNNHRFHHTSIANTLK